MWASATTATRSQAQDPASPFGKLLRFNEDGTIPTDNPFYATQSGLARAVWASGLRNPFTFAVQPGTGRIHINDVGQDSWEEIDLGAAGANYGWPYSEGPNDIVPGVRLTAPLFTYPHSDPDPLGSGPGGFIVGHAIVGGTFYPPDGSFPDGLPRPVLLLRFHRPVHRPARRCKRQCRVHLRPPFGPAGRPAGGHRRRALRADARRHHPHQRTLRAQRGGSSPRRQTLASQGCCSRGRPSGR